MNNVKKTALFLKDGFPNVIVVVNALVYIFGVIAISCTIVIVIVVVVVPSLPSYPLTHRVCTLR